jgi:hypothetical protein
MARQVLDGIGKCLKTSYINRILCLPRTLDRGPGGTAAPRFLCWSLADANCIYPQR